MKVIIQIYVHGLDTNLSHSPYAQYLANQQVNSPLSWSKDMFAGW
jgi:hypothetical protein